MSKVPQYAHVILPLAVNGYTYAVPAHLTVQVGSLVCVPLGKTKRHWGIVSALQPNAPQGVTCKEILQVAYPYPLVTPHQLQLWSWLAGYYCCSLGEVFKAAVPTLLQHDAFKPLQVLYVAITGQTRLAKTKQQKAILDRYNQLAAKKALVTEPVEVPKLGLLSTPVLKSDLLEGQSVSAFQTLVKNGVLSCYCQESSRLQLADSSVDWPVLSQAQQTALQQINQCFEQKPMVLLHGVTASGKTEIYLQKIKEVVEQGGQVLYLVPEIALTAQLENRLARVLGSKMVAYHSQITDNKRAEIYLNLLQNKGIQVVLGTRSSVFLPFTHLQLVVIDEEHEPSYKQYEPAPRYHAKNAALMMAQMAGAKTLLGSATPSIESYYLAQKGVYAYVSLQERYHQAVLPHIEVIDRQDAFKKNRMKDMFSWYLLEKMRQTLQAGKQVILFQNRRGFSSYVECVACNYIPKCKHCDVSLTYHKKTDKLVCHYCGYSMPMPQTCPSCGAEKLKDRGFGTEKVIEALQTYFPEVKTDRLDVDVTRLRTQFEGVIKRFACGETQILVGTQMVAKGLDFDNVGLVGILNADNMMNFPDFRAAERAFQLMVQVSGRAGRRQEQGMVVLQTTQPEHYIIPAVLNQQMEDFYRVELQERCDFMYPPFARIIEVQVRHKQLQLASAVIEKMANQVKKLPDVTVLGPGSALVGKVQTYFVKQFLLKIKGTGTQVRACLMQQMALLKKEVPSAQIIIDVDPL
ncbi:MAG: primosomal protein N' [Paludibacteraceae bacterium]|nr:primosomal protein N' [Paludibacteraceae bacterium]